MPYLLVRQKVEDYNKWYKVFKSHEEAQINAGLKDLQLLQDASDPNTIVCIFRIDDLEKARAFTQAPQAIEAQTQSGVIGKPEVLLLNEIILAK